MNHSFNFIIYLILAKFHMNIYMEKSLWSLCSGRFELKKKNVLNIY